jgi:hypothetical protein
MHHSRFGTHRRKLNTLIITGILMAALLFLCLYGMNRIGTGSADRSEKLLQEALTQDITECYALEGSYPPSLAYLEEHYGLTYDRNLFYIDYQPVASNIRPDCTIIRMDK